MCGKVITRALKSAIVRRYAAWPFLGGVATGGKWQRVERLAAGKESDGLRPNSTDHPMLSTIRRQTGRSSVNGVADRLQTIPDHDFVDLTRDNS